MAKAKTKQTRVTGRSAAVYEFLLGMKGVTKFHVSEVAEATGLNEQQIQSALSYLRNHKGEKIEILARGQVYQYDPNGKDEVEAPEPFQEDAPEDTDPGRMTFDYIGVTREGGMILQAADGVLYRAEKL